MRQHPARLFVATRGRGFTDRTPDIAAAVEASGVRTGLAVIFVRHTSASLVIQENADPAVQRDLLRWLGRLAPESAAWEHQDEGPDDMPSHARAALLRTSETVPVADGRLVLGRWQGIQLVEHRTTPHRREVVVHVSGE